MFLQKIRELVQIISPEKLTVIFPEDLYIPSSRQSPAYLVTGVTTKGSGVKIFMKSLEDPNPIDLIESSPSSLMKSILTRLALLANPKIVFAHKQDAYDYDGPPFNDLLTDEFGQFLY